jgi:hypothetical protein
VRRDRPRVTHAGSVLPRPAILRLVWVLAVLQFFVWLFALTFVAMAALCLAGIDLLVWLEAGGAAVAVHFAVIAAMLLRRGGRRASDAIAP